MALTLPRWIAAFVIGALLLVPVAIGYGHLDIWNEGTYSVPPEEVGPGFWANVAAEQVANDAARLADRVRILQIRDSLTQAPLALTPVAPGMDIAIDRALNPDLRPALVSLVSRAHALSVPHSVATPVVVAFVLDTTRMVRGVGRQSAYGPLAVTYVLPTAARPSCMVVARFSRTAFIPRSEPNPSDPRWLRDEPIDERLLGPCAFYAAFGSPGPNVQRWLESGAWSLGSVNRWDESSGSAWRFKVQNMEFYAAQQNYWGLKHFDGEGVRSLVSSVGAECLASLAGACASALLSPFEKTTRIRLLATGVASPANFERAISGNIFSQGSFGARQEQLLSDFIHTQGQERFGRAWHSSRSVTDAFGVDAGIDLDQTTRVWAQDSFGKQELGPVIHSAGLLTGGIGVLVGVLLTLLAARRRQTT